MSVADKLVEVHVILVCPDCGETKEANLKVPTGTKVADSVPRTCTDCAVKVDKLGRPRKAKPRKSLSLDNQDYRTDRFASPRLPGGMTGTRAHPGTGATEPYDFDAARREARICRAAVRLAELKVLSLVKDERERAVLELWRAGKSGSEISRELRISKAHVFNIVKTAIEKLKRLRSVGLDAFVFGNDGEIVLEREPQIGAHQMVPDDFDDFDAEDWEYRLGLGEED